MSHIEVSTRIRKDANNLWREIGSSQGVGAWHPWLKTVQGQGEQPGAIRTAETPDGRKQVERLEKLDSRDDSYCYAMLSSPMPVEDYTGEFRSRDEGDGTKHNRMVQRFSGCIRRGKHCRRQHPSISQRRPGKPGKNVLLILGRRQRSSNHTGAND